MPRCVTAQTRVDELYPRSSEERQRAAPSEKVPPAESTAGGVIVCVAGVAITTPSAAGNADGPRGRASTRRPPSRASPSAGRTTNR
jgi:hypothetical protein